MSTSIGGARLNRRKFLKGAIAGLTLSVPLLQACSSAQAPSPTAAKPAAASTQAPAVPAAPAATAAPAAAAPKVGGKAVFCLNNEPPGLDPVQSNNVNEGAVMLNIYDTLVFISSDWKIHPGLATSWESSPDAKVWTFKLRKDVKFHDGTPFNAQAVKDHVERHFDKNFRMGSAPTRVYDAFEAAEVVDEFTVRIRHKQPRPGFLLGLSGPHLGIASPTAAKKYGPDLRINPVGTGPFKFKEFVAKSHITLLRNPDYKWAPPLFKNQGPAYLDEVTFRFIEEAQTRLAALESGEMHFVDMIPYSEVPRISGDPKYKVMSLTIPGMPQMNYMHVGLSPTDDLAVRQAAIYATNKDAIIKTVYFNTAKKAYGPLSALLPEYDPAVEKMYSFDPAKAKDLLEKAGWKAGADGVRAKDGKRLEVTLVENKGWNDWVQVLQSNLKDVGFEAKILQTTGASNIEAIRSGKYQMPCMGSIFLDSANLINIWHSRGLGTSNNGSFYKNARLDELLDSGQSEADTTKRKAIFSEIQKHIMENALMIPIFELAFHLGMSAKVEGLKVDPSGYYKWMYDVSLK